MRTFNLFLLLIICIAGKAQEVEKFFDHNWKECEPAVARFVSYTKETDSGWLRKDYFIATKKLQMMGLYMDKQTKVRNGWFRYYYSNGILKNIGKIVSEKRQGLWLSYHTNGMSSDSTFYDFGIPVGISMGWHPNGYVADSIVYTHDIDTKVFWYDNGMASAAGRSKDGEEMGVWQYFHKNGQLAAKEKYDMGKLMDRQYFNENGQPETDTASKDRDASFKGGAKGWDKFVYKRIYFPHGYKFSAGDEVTVLVTARIDEEGNVTEPFVELPLHPAFDEAAISIFKQSPKWIPAISHNRTVSQYVRQAITFTQDY